MDPDGNSQSNAQCSHHNHSHDHSGGCCKTVPTPSVCQSLDEMDFERGIWQAALDDDEKRIEHLINSQHIHPDLTDAYGYTALHYAARNGNMRAAKCLVKFGAVLNCQTRNNGATPLHRAVIGKKPEMVEYLLSCGTDLTLKDNDGLTCIDRAISEGNEGIIQIFKKYQGSKVPK